MKKLLTYLIFLIAIVNYTNAQNITFSAQANKTVSVGQQFRLSFSVNAKGTSFRAPSLSDFDVLMGPSQNSSSSMQIINGNVSQSYSYSFTYILVANKEGKFTIKPASIKVDGKTYTSNSLTINVIKGKANNTQNNNNSNSNSNQANSNQINADNIFVRVYLNKNSAYIGEQIIATVKLYTRVGISGFDEINFPAYDGFFSQEIPTSNNINFKRENVDGNVYNVGVLQKMILYPQRSGKLKIKPFTISVVVQKRVRAVSFFDSGYRNVKTKLKSNALSVNIKPLPNKPAGFKNAVGDFKLTAKLDKNKTKADDPIVLTVKISGNGNLKLIDEPKFDFPPDFDVYDPKIKTNIKNDNSGAHGSISYEYLIIPRNGGDFKIPSYNFTYFNVSKNKYITLSTNDFNIHVEKSSNGDSKTVVNNISKENVKYLNKDIRYIKTSDFKLKKLQKHFFGSLLFYLIYIISFIVAVAIYLLKRKSIKQKANIIALKNRKANKIAKKRLKTANKYLNEQNDESFYQEITNAIWGYLSDKLNIQMANLNKDNVGEVLKENNIDDDKVNDLLSLLDKCEFARFSSHNSTNDLNEVYNQASGLISFMENNIN